MSAQGAISPYRANRFAFLFSVAALGAVALYFGYGIVDRAGLQKRETTATVLETQHNPPGHSYRTTIAAGRAWTQSDETADTYVAVLQVQDEQTSGFISKDLYNALKRGDNVRATVQRTRLSGRLEALAITRQ